MRNCSNNDLIDKLQFSSLTAETELYFNVLRNSESCKKINTRMYTETTADLATFDTFLVPEDRYDCMPDGCKNTGTLMLRAAGDASHEAVFEAKYDSTTYYAGVITYYVYVKEPGSYTVTTTLADIRDDGGETPNADVYTNTFTAETAPAFYPITVDLTKEPSSISGTGWIPTESGNTIEIGVIQANGSAEEVTDIGISSIYFYDTIADFETNDTVVVGCIDDISGDMTADVLDATCGRSGYDSSTAAVEKTITAKAITANFDSLNPFVREGDQTESFIPQNTTREVKCVMIDGVRYGYVQVPDMYTDECGLFVAQIADQCNITHSMLKRVNMPDIIELGSDQFMVLDGTTTEQLDAGTVLVNERLIEKTLNITYPRRVLAKHTVAEEAGFYDRRYRMIMVIRTEDGVQYTRVYNNVFITSFPDTFTREETSMAFTVSIQRDRRGRWYETFEAVE